MQSISTKMLYLCSLGLILGACGGDAAESYADDTDAEATASEPAATAASMNGLLNPNLAGEPEMVAVGIPAALAETIASSRPVMTMLMLDAMLATGMDDDARQALYANVWVPLDLNTASRDDILLIPGVGDRMAHEFEEYRPYAAMAEFRREMAKYVDDAEVERLAQYVFVPIDLNTATREQILALPGVGERMAHEFEEYRPYTDMDQFRREMGKYVDEGEVERLARLVTLN